MQTTNSLDSVILDDHQPANINYVKARCVIEEQMKSRTDKREAKLAVIEHLKGTLVHPSEAALKKGATKQVKFPDNTSARF